MAIKNTFSKLPASRYISDAQEALVKAGASGIQTFYEEGKIVGLSFTIPINNNFIQFKLPINWRNFQRVLEREGNNRSGDDNYAYRVAWACTKDWIEAQMAFIESENATLAQIFLPYAVTKNGNTLFENVVSNPSLLLGDGQ